ncbi:MAG: Tetratricopeptide repeat protein, partial [Candidatus Poribacteria bacterium]|nr:Tetratricopeptide repeat protein [Candidatus Poribacteria bacterium]
NYELAIQSAKDDITKGQIQFEIGNNYFTAEDYQMAINAYKKLMETYPNDSNFSEARYYIAESYWWLKDYQNGLQTYTEVLDKEPNGPHAVECMFKIGQCNYQLGNKELALEWYDKIINDHSDSPLVKDAVYEKLWALGDLKRYDEVEKVGREYIEKYKKDPTYDVAAAETQMKLGDIKYEAGNYSSAADEYLMVVSDYSNLPKFDPFKARSLLQAGTAYYTLSENSNWDEVTLRKSTDAYEQLLNMYQRNFDEKRSFDGRDEYVTSAVINLGLAYSTLKEIDKANQTLSMLPKTNPEYGRAVYLRGKALADAGRTDEAMVAYREMVNNKGLSQDWRSRAAIELASNLTKAGRFQEALTEYQNIVTEYPDSEFLSTAIYYAGSSYYELEPKTPENMNNAIAFFQQVVDKYSESETGPWAYIGMMAAYDQLGSYDKIVTLADQMETKYTGSKIVRVEEALDLARRRKVDSMQKLESGATADALVPELRKIVANPVGDEEGKAAAQMRIGMLLFGEKRYEEAITEYQILLDKFPGKYTGAAYYQMAASAYSMDDPAKAIDSAKKGLEVPDLTQEIKTGLYYTMGLAYGKVQNPAEEMTAMEQTVQSAEGATSDNVKQMSLAARRGLAKAYADTKQYQDAEKQYIYLGENLATPAEKADAYFWLARLYEDMQQYPKAIETYDKVVQVNGSEILSAQSLYFEGVLYTNSVKNDEKALNAFTELVNKYSSSTDSNVKQMVTDANIRIPDLLTSLGKFDEALAGARKARETAIASGTKEEKINTQYQVANLLGQRISKLAETGKSDQALSKEAAGEFVKVVDLAKPFNGLSDDMKLVAAASLYNATFIYYNMGGYDNFVQAAKYGEMLIDNFPKNENYQSTLQLMGFTTYEMARLKADLPGFEKAAQLFLRFAKEFPRNKDAGNAQYQAGESYFTVGGGYTVDKQKAKAADAYRKAVSAYRGFVNNYPGNEYAPDALYAMASSYAYISDLLSDPREMNNMNNVYRELVDKYPKSKYAAVAFEAVGNDYYNQATAPGVAEKTQTDNFKQALKYYRQGLQVPNIENKTKQALEIYVRETESLLAQKPYSLALQLVPTEGTNPELKKQNAPKAIPILNNIISTYPDTDVADLSYVQLGLCYESLEQWDNAISAYGKLLKKYTDSKGNPIIPYSDNVVAAVEFAKGRRTSIMSFQASTRASKQSGR